MRLLSCTFNYTFYTNSNSVVHAKVLSKRPLTFIVFIKKKLCLGMNKETKFCRPKADNLCVGEPGLRGFLPGLFAGPLKELAPFCNKIYSIQMAGKRRRLVFLSNLAENWKKRGKNRRKQTEISYVHKLSVSWWILIKFGVVAAEIIYFKRSNFYLDRLSESS